MRCGKRLCSLELDLMRAGEASIENMRKPAPGESRPTDGGYR